MKHLSTLLLAAALMAASCNKEIDMSGPSTHGKYAAELRNNPSELRIGNNRVILGGDIYRRNYGSGELINCMMKLVDKDRRQLDTSITIKKLYWIRNDDVWETPPASVTRHFAQEIHATANGAPLWDPNVYVEPVLDFEARGKSYRILGAPALVQKLP